MDHLAQAHHHLLQYAIKPSIQRSAIMNFLMRNCIHPTVDDIYIALNPKMPTLSKTTVYNTLNLFVEKGAVRMLTLDEKNARYDADITAHGHFMCKICGKVYDMMDLNPIIFQLPQNSEFKIEATEISYSGKCKECV